MSQISQYNKFLNIISFTFIQQFPAFIFGFRVHNLKNFISPSRNSILISCVAYLGTGVIGAINLIPRPDTNCLVHRFANIRFTIINTAWLCEPSSIHNSPERMRSVSPRTVYGYRLEFGFCNTFINDSRSCSRKDSSQLLERTTVMGFIILHTSERLTGC